MSITHWVALHFEKLQIFILVGGVLLAFIMIKGGSNPSQFKVREADRKDLDQILKNKSDLANAKLTRRKNEPPPIPLNLPGIRLSGENHEILGVSENDTDTEIMAAYRDAIKRFHPDKIQGQAKEQMKFYEEASVILNRAKEQMLKKK